MAFLASLNTLTNGQLLFIGLLIFVAVLIFPHLIRRKNIQRCILEKTKKGEIIRPEDFAGKKQKLFFTHNAQSSEIEELLVKLKTYAFKHEMKIVFPGSFPYNGKNSTASSRRHAAPWIRGRFFINPLDNFSKLICLFSGIKK